MRKQTHTQNSNATFQLHPPKINISIHNQLVAVNTMKQSHPIEKQNPVIQKKS